MKKCHKLFIAALAAALSASLAIAAPATVAGYVAPNGYVGDAHYVNDKVVAVVDFARIPADSSAKIALAKIPEGFLVRGAAIKPVTDFNGGTYTNAAAFTANIGTNAAANAVQAFSQWSATAVKVPSIASLQTPVLVPKGVPYYLYIVPSAAVNSGAFTVTLYGDRPFMD